MTEPLASVVAGLLTIVVFVGFGFCVTWLFKKARGLTPPSKIERTSNFTFTKKNTAIFIIALFTAGILSAITGNKYSGLGILLIVVAYIANSENNARK